MENNIIVTEPKWKIILRKINKIIFVIYLISCGAIFLHLLIPHPDFFSEPFSSILYSIRIVFLYLHPLVILFGFLVGLCFIFRVNKIGEKRNFKNIILGLIVGLLLFLIGTFVVAMDNPMLDANFWDLFPNDHAHL